MLWSEWVNGHVLNGLNHQYICPDQTGYTIHECRNACVGWKLESPTRGYLSTTLHRRFVANFECYRYDTNSVNTIGILNLGALLKVEML